MALRKSIDGLFGKKYGFLTVLSDEGVRNYSRMIKCRCDCGVIKDYILANVVKGNTKSCGCLWVTVSTAIKTTHGLSQHPLSNVYHNMLDRCYKESYKSYKDYGAKGVKVCEEWRQDFKAFFNWAIKNGWAKGLQLDKDKLSPYKSGVLYCPDLCCFLTSEENAKYKSSSRIIKYKNVSMGLSDWCKKLNFKFTSIRGRLDKGWSIEKALEVPIDIRFRKKVKPKQIV